MADDFLLFQRRLAGSSGSDEQQWQQWQQWQQRQRRQRQCGWCWRLRRRSARLWDVVACHVHVLSRVCPCMFARLFHAAPMHRTAVPDRDAGRLILQGIYVLGGPIGPFFSLVPQGRRGQLGL